MENAKTTRLRQFRTGRSGLLERRDDGEGDVLCGLWVPDDGGIPVEVDVTNRGEFVVVVVGRSIGSLTSQR